MSGFHGNRILQRTVDALVLQAGVTAFVETGTHRADTTVHVASRHPSLPVFTCEVDPGYLAISKAAVAPHANVRLSGESSEKFIDRLIVENALGGLPLFFLDAHWYDYWPLPDEVTSIAKLPRFIFLVDDFAVPGQPHFETSAGGGGTIGEHRSKADTRPCSMALIGSLLPADCEVAYPTYGKMEAYGSPKVPHLVGYVIVAKGVHSIDAIKTDPMHSWSGIR
jgi:hypothetical protein